MPASGSFQRLPIPSAATAAARQSSSASRSRRAAAANSDSVSPSASSWNCPRTQFPDFAAAAGEAAQLQRHFVADRLPRHRVGRHQLGPVVEQPLGDEPEGAGEQRVRAVRGDGDARVALVPDPGVAVVVVPAARQALGQRGGGGRHHGAAGRGEPAQHRVGVPRVGQRDQVIAARCDIRPRLLGRRPALPGVGRLGGELAIGQLKHEVVRRPRCELDPHPQPAVRQPRLARPRPAEPGVAAAAGPGVAVPVEVGHGGAAVARPQVEGHGDLGGAVDRLDPAQQDGPVRVGGHGERFPAFDPGVADPAVAPDQAAALVVAAPHVPGVGRGDRVLAGTAEQAAEGGRAVPARHAEPRDRAVGADHGTALAVGDQRVLAQHARRGQVAPPPR